MSGPSDPSAAALAAATDAIKAAARFLADGDPEEAERYARLAERLAVAGAKVAALHTPEQGEDEDSDEEVLERFHARMRALKDAAENDDMTALQKAGWDGPA